MRIPSQTMTGRATPGHSCPRPRGTSPPLRARSKSVRQVEALIDENRFDLFFNLCDGAADQDIPGIEIIQKLEQRGVPYAGACSECYEPTRVEMKEACHRLGIATPNYVVASTEEDVERAARELQFPTLRQALQQLCERRPEPPVPCQVAGRTAHPGQEDHVPPRGGAHRGIHRWHRVHGAWWPRIQRTR